MPRGSKTCPKCNTTTGPRTFKCSQCGYNYPVKGNTVAGPNTTLQAPTIPTLPIESSEPIVTPTGDAPPVELPKSSAPYLMENNHPLFDFRKTTGKPLAIVRVPFGETIQHFISMLTMGKAAYLSCVTTRGEAIILGVEPIAA